MAIDMKKLKSDLKLTAQACADAKRAYKEAQRALSRAPANMAWKERLPLSNAVDRARQAAAEESEDMTKLCVFRAHLRGRTHLTSNSCYADQAEGWIDLLEERYALRPDAQSASA